MGISDRDSAHLLQPECDRGRLTAGVGASDIHSRGMKPELISSLTPYREGVYNENKKYCPYCQPMLADSG